jgi:cell volume regulation protein A
LDVAIPQKAKKLTPTDLLFLENPKTIMREIAIGTDCYAANKKIVELGFPKNAIIAMIKRGNQFITPSGSTKIESDDILIVLADQQKIIDEVYKTLKINTPIQ